MAGLSYKRIKTNAKGKGNEQLEYQLKYKRYRQKKMEVAALENIC